MPHNSKVTDSNDFWLTIAFICMVAAVAGFWLSSPSQAPALNEPSGSWAQGYKQGRDDTNARRDEQELGDEKKLEGAGLCVYAEKVCHANSISGRAEHRRATPKAH